MPRAAALFGVRRFAAPTDEVRYLLALERISERSSIASGATCVSAAVAHFREVRAAPPRCHAASCIRHRQQRRGADQRGARLWSASSRSALTISLYSSTRTSCRFAAAYPRQCTQSGLHHHASYRVGVPVTRARGPIRVALPASPHGRQAVLPDAGAPLRRSFGLACRPSPRSERRVASSPASRARRRKPRARTGGTRL